MVTGTFSFFMKNATERRDRVDNRPTLASYSGGLGFKSLLTEGFRVFLSPSRRMPE
jgi:hypothetical protein